MSLWEFKVLTLENNDWLKVTRDVCSSEINNWFIVLNSKFKEIKWFGIISSSKHNIIWSLLLMVSKHEQPTIILWGHRLKRHYILHGMHIMACPHKYSADFWVSSHLYNVSHKCLHCVTSLLSFHKNRCLDSLYQLWCLLLELLPSLVSFRFLN